ncbi:molybdate ABC transporter substrate-binding protein [Actinoallomurus bryophytorum]|uniref:Molybdate transport system substrate-binding protein n=1 Tax=Actinoallomurus bryophytorum TaxID=1490222 RepID=A0A543CD96_9ACTN|nr:molybdate ABC transporter substrate-binding protein [Actinoallomurus bryophytorum]TQL95076.1 molybdate transport system substrate-binding protein [Actinoallomurus bryophytorum]
MPYFSRLAAFVAVALALAGCGIASGDERFTLRVLAASSLTDAFGELGTAYRSANRHVTSVQFEFAGSQEVAGDVADREQADVLATADDVSMNIAAEHVTNNLAFAHGSMTIAVAPDNPHRIRGLADLADPRLRVVLGGPTVPVGRYAMEVLAKAGVTVRPKSEEADARTVLTRVRTGVADAGIVYVTDMRSAGVSAMSVAIPVQQNVTATYFAAAVRQSKHGSAAKDFVTWLRSPTAASILRKYGFMPA